MYGTPVAVKWSLDIIKKLEPIPGLKLKWIKMRVYAPTAESAVLCRQLLPSNLDVWEDERMNFIYPRRELQMQLPYGVQLFLLMFYRVGPDEGYLTLLFQMWKSAFLKS